MAAFVSRAVVPTGPGGLSRVEQRMSETCVAVLHTTHHTLKAERLLKNRGVGYKVIMKPRGVTTDCGLAIEFGRADAPAVIDVLRQNALAAEGVYVCVDGALRERIAAFDE